MSDTIEWDEKNESWEEHLTKYPHPTALTFPDNYDMPDGVCIAGGWSYDWATEGKMKGAVVQLISPRAFELFPEAPKEGPYRGLLWFSRKELSNLCALEDRMGLDFHGLAHVL